MSDENLEDVLENLEMDEIDPGEVKAHLDCYGGEDPGKTEYMLAKELARDAPEIFEIDADIYAPSSVLKRYELEGELPEGSDIILQADDHGNYETSLDNDTYNIKVRRHVSQLGLRRIL